MLAILTLAVGVVALTIWLLHRQSRDRALAAFGIFATLYGIRLLLDVWSVGWVLGLPRAVGNYAVATITYIIPISGVLFFEQFAAERWRWAVWLLLRVQVAFAVVAVVLMALTREPRVATAANNILVLCGLGGLLAAMGVGMQRGSPPRDARVLSVGLVLFGMAALYANMADSKFGQANQLVEPAGLFVLVCCLEYVVWRQGFERERRLVGIESDLEIARQIQASILPQKMPAVRGVEVAMRYLPMTAVAGDFYDFVCVDAQSLGILVADVSGHGVPAALIASTVKVAMASAAAQAGDPAKVMAAPNQVLAGQLCGTSVTAAYLFLDTVPGRAIYSAAGHPPLLFCRDGGVQAVVENGLILGVFAGAWYVNREIALVCGDRLLLYTDGVTEAGGPERMFGDSSLHEVIRGGQSLESERFAAALVDEVRAVTGTTEQQDDITASTPQSGSLQLVPDPGSPAQP